MHTWKIFQANGKLKRLSRMGIDEITCVLKEQEEVLKALLLRVEQGEWWLSGQVAIVQGNIEDLEEALRELGTERKMGQEALLT